MARFLLEIRCEEIPANALEGARRQLREGFARALAEAGFADVVVSAWSTSRRLSLSADPLPSSQPDREEQLVGPPTSAAFKPDGSPTKAAEGFARKAGVPVDRLDRVSTAKGEYLAATVRHPGRPTAEILAEVTPRVVAGLRFPKMMRWGLGRHLFARPVHGVVALLDREVVPLELFGLPSGRETVGHRVHAPAPFALEDAREYGEELARRAVIVDPEVRRQMLAALAAALAAEQGCSVHPDPELMAEHVELVEWPGLLCGAIEPRFLELPTEVVVTTLRHHQKCLVLETAGGTLAPFFLTVVDRRDDPTGVIRQGNEWVIGARLEDAAFFFAEDRKHPFEALAPRLDRLEFHRRLGSVGAKADRVGALAARLATACGLPHDAAGLARAARLVKADLASHMVGEFPELQGVMGGHYLRLEGADAELWTAARDHYRPLGFDDRPPASATGSLLAAADRLDTLAGLFAVGEVPSGSRDPFGLRRAAQGLVHILAETGWALDWRRATLAAVTHMPALEVPPFEVANPLDEFIVDRIRRYLTEVTGVAADTADAVLGSTATTVPDLVARARALQTVRSGPEIRALALAFKRVRNITDRQPEATLRPELLTEAGEVALHSAWDGFHRQLAEHLAHDRLDQAFAAMGRLAATLDRFFTEVLVLCDDPAVASNRVALLKSLGRDFLALADLSKLQIEGDTT